LRKDLTNVNAMLPYEILHIVSKPNFSCECLEPLYMIYILIWAIRYPKSISRFNWIEEIPCLRFKFVFLSPWLPIIFNPASLNKIIFNCVVSADNFEYFLFFWQIMRFFISRKLFFGFSCSLSFIKIARIIRFICQYEVLILISSRPLCSIWTFVSALFDQFACSNCIFQDHNH